MSPSQKDDDGQEWEEREWDVLWKGNYILSNASPLAREWIVTLGNEKAALEERVRVLEEALREAEWTAHAEGLAEDMHCGVCLSRQDEGHEQDCSVRRALLSPAAATEGGEGA